MYEQKRACEVPRSLKRRVMTGLAPTCLEVGKTKTQAVDG